MNFTELEKLVIDWANEKTILKNGTPLAQAEMQGLKLTDCLESAYNVIKNRTGKMISGQFVKD